MKQLNNKGYMLVEIILAFVLAMTIMYFITELTIKVKNKNDDLLVRSLTATDQAIIYNMIMKDYYDNNTISDDIVCESVDGGTVEDPLTGQIINKRKYKFTYNDKTVILNEYIDYCRYDKDNNKIIIEINQLSDEDFSVVIPT